MLAHAALFLENRKKYPEMGGRFHRKASFLEATTRLKRSGQASTLEQRSDVMTERKEIFRALVGSHNYNLNNRDSDKDYKVFMMPTFNDLYSGKQYSSDIIREDADYNYHDIRKLPDLLFKANINFIEVLFSQEYSFAGSKEKQFFDTLFEKREELAAMNLPYLYNACIGMALNKMKMIHKFSDSNEKYKQFGYNIKEVTHAFRVLNFLVRYSRTNNFADSLYCRPESDSYYFLMKLKEGKFSEEEAKSLVHLELERVRSVTYFSEQKVNKELYEEIKEHVKEYVRANILEAAS